MIQKRTKIIATIGPSSNNESTLRNLILEGVNLFRLNFSHIKHEDAAALILVIKELDKELGTQTGILADLQGPKIRIGNVLNNKVELKDNSIVTFTTEEIESTESLLGIRYPDFAKDVEPGDDILIDDGNMKLVVLTTDKKSLVTAKVINGGFLTPRKGVNLPKTRISLSSITEKDFADLKFIVTQPIDWLALSFVRSVNDIIRLRNILKEEKVDIAIIAKIEKPSALKQIDAIIKESDAIMIARGDLGVEIPVEELPLAQKSMITKCLAASKPVIIATQMLESMINNVTPSRAEINDVANGVFDGADALMLSAETASGKFPELVVNTMVRIIKTIEEQGNIFHKNVEIDLKSTTFLSDQLCKTASNLAFENKAKALIGMTQSGYTAYRLASFRPEAKIYAFTNNDRLLTRLSLCWGVQCFIYNKKNSTDESIEDSIAILKEKELVMKDEIVINLTSMPLNKMARTNTLKFSIVE